VLYISDTSESGLRLGVISVYFILCYITLGIGLCNLLTSVVVDFKKVLHKKAGKDRREELRTKFKAAVRVIMTFNKLKRLSLAFASPHDAASVANSSGESSKANSSNCTPRLGPEEEVPGTQLVPSSLGGQQQRPVSLPLSRTASNSSQESVSKGPGLRRRNTNHYIRSVSPETLYRRAEQKLTATEKQVLDEVNSRDLRYANLVETFSKKSVENPLWNRHEVMVVPDLANWRLLLWQHSEGQSS